MRQTDLVPAICVLTWIPLVLVADQHQSLAAQNAWGLVSWILLIALVARETPLVRVQVAVVVVFATVVEYTFSAGLHVYVYRLDNVPAFVPPGHGLVYLGAVALARSPLFEQHRRLLLTTVLLVGGGYALWGISPLAARPDVLGAFWFVCLLGFVAWGRSPLLYVGAFIVVTYLELIGTHLGVWTWSAHDPTGLVTIGNPPSGAAGGYAWFDLVALAAAGAIIDKSRDYRDLRVFKALISARSWVIWRPISASANTADSSSSASEMSSGWMPGTGSSAGIMSSRLPIT